MHLAEDLGFRESLIKRRSEVNAWASLHIYIDTSSCPYKASCVQMELGLLTCDM